MEDVKKLRDQTGAGIMDCKTALTEKKGDLKEAVKYLREKGIAKAEQRSDRKAGEGMIASYVHPGDRLGVILELNSETDFLSRTDEFRQLAKDLCMQVAASAPRYVQREDVPEEIKKAEKEIYRNQAKESGKPEGVLEKIAEGKLEKFYQESCLMEQAFIKDPEKNIKTLVTELIAKTGENIKVKRFVRYVLGE
jgi:elongation factor Ts